jgi:hypothetical protein
MAVEMLTRQSNPLGRREATAAGKRGRKNWCRFRAPGILCRKDV